MSDILTAFSGAKRSDSGGRKVVDKLYGLKGNLNPVFAGADRPEFHKTLDGFEQVCVEKEVTNLVDIAQQKFEGWAERDGATAIVTQGQSFSPLTENGATRVQISGGTSLEKYRTTATENAEDTGVKYAFGVFVKNNLSTPFNILVSNITSPGIRFTVGAYQTVFVDLVGETREGFAPDTLQIRMSFETQNIGDEIDCIAYQPSIYKGAYNTLFTEGTRLAPRPVIENSVPEFGAFYCAGEVIVDSNVDVIPIYSTDTSIDPDNRFSLFTRTSGTIQARLYGYQNTVKTNIPLNTRLWLFSLINYYESGIEIYIGDVDGNLEKKLSLISEPLGNFNDLHLARSAGTSSMRHNEFGFRSNVNSSQVQELYKQIGIRQGKFSQINYTDAT